jgi:hypothetical protein
LVGAVQWQKQARRMVLRNSKILSNTLSLALALDGTSAPQNNTARGTER